MKLILAIVQADAVEAVSRALVEQRFTVTQISSMGGFLRRGNTTLVVGVDESQVARAMTTLRDVCQPLSKGEAHAATVFVIDANQYIQI